MFGVNCSPFLLNGTLRVHLQKYELDDPEFVAELLRSMHLDDLVSGGKNEEEVKGLYDYASKRLAEGGFKLQKWHTDDLETRQFFDERETKSRQEEKKLVQYPDSYAKETLGTQSNLKGHKVLGLEGDCDKDTLQFDLGKLAIAASKLCPTKRNILSVLAGLFDLLGTVSPQLLQSSLYFKNCAFKG